MSVRIGNAGAGNGGICSIKLLDALVGRVTVDILGLGGAVVAVKVLGGDGAIGDGVCGRPWDTESRRFSFERKLRHPPGDFSSLCTSRSPPWLAPASPFALNVLRVGTGAVGVVRSAFKDREYRSELKNPPEPLAAEGVAFRVATGMAGGAGNG